MCKNVIYKASLITITRAFFTVQTYVTLAEFPNYFLQSNTFLPDESYLCTHIPIRPSLSIAMLSSFISPLLSFAILTLFLGRKNYLRFQALYYTFKQTKTNTHLDKEEKKIILSKVNNCFK